MGSRNPEMPVGGETARAVGVAATSAGAAAVATAASAWCVPLIAPLVVAVLGASGAAWAAGLKPYSPCLLAVSAVFLGVGFCTVYRPRPVTVGEACPVRRPRLPRVILWTAGVMWLAAVALNLLQLLPARVG